MWFLAKSVPRPPWLGSLAVPGDTRAAPEPTSSGRDGPQFWERKGQPHFFAFLFFFNCDEIANLHPETKIKWREVCHRGWSSSGVGREGSDGVGRPCLATFPIG